jgi:F0F1-type ATP synthase membrane subunit b/b'
MEIFKLLDANLIVAQIICFFLVLWLLRKFLWGPALKMIDQRRDRIAAELKAI